MRIIATLTLNTLPTFLVLATTSIVMAAFGLLVVARTYRRAYGWYFAFTMAGVCSWALGDLLILFARTPSVLHVGAELFYIAPMIIPVFIWFFAISYPEARSIGWIPPFISGISFAVLSLLFLFKFDFFIKDIHITNTLNVPHPSTIGFLVYSAYFSLFFILTYVAFLLKMRRIRGMSHTQVVYTFFGALVASLPALFTNLSLPLIGTTGLIWLGPFFTLVFAVAVTTAIIRHRLFDIRLYAVRSVAYLLALFVTALLYVVFAVILSNSLLNVPMRATSVTLLAFITLAVAFLFHPLKRFFDRITRKWFYQEGYDPQEFFNQFNQTLVENAELDKLLKASSSLVVEIVKSEFCVVGLEPHGFMKPRITGSANKIFDRRDVDRGRRLLARIDSNVIVTDYLGADQEELKALLIKDNIALLCRLTSGPGQELGYVMVGPKKSGNPYNRQDLGVFEALANELVIAIQNALRFEEIEHFNTTLQNRIAEATKRLRRSNEKLRLLDETKDDFISMASHQLRTPLTSVKGYLSLVLEGDAGPIKPPQRKLLTQAFISSQRMVYLIADLLNVSRLRTGKFLIEPSPVNLADVVADEVSQLLETAQARSLNLTYHQPAHFPLLSLDETKTRQVIMNFIDNAIYYTPSGGHIDVSLSETAKSIELKVTDTGIGVPKAEQHHLFTKFYRAKNAQKARPDGTGLGLFMAKKVIVAQGGAIIFSSREDKGSTFGFSFAKERIALKNPPQKQA